VEWKYIQFVTTDQYTTVWSSTLSELINPSSLPQDEMIEGRQFKGNEEIIYIKRSVRGRLDFVPTSLLTLYFAHRQ
jgi:hypothetical protein